MNRLPLLLALCLAACAPAASPAPAKTPAGVHRLGAVAQLQSQLTIGLQLQGSGISSTWSSGAIFNNPSPGSQIPVALAAGNNAIPVPAGARAIILIPTPSSVVVKMFKTLVGDTGSQMSNTDPTVFSFVPGSLPSNVWINATAADSVFVFFT